MVSRRAHAQLSNTFGATSSLIVLHSAAFTFIAPRNGTTVRLVPRDEVITLNEGDELRVVGEAAWPVDIWLFDEGPRPGADDAEFEIRADPDALVRWFVNGEERTRPEDPPRLASAAAGDPHPAYVSDAHFGAGCIEITICGADVDEQALRALGGQRPAPARFFDRLMDSLLDRLFGTSGSSWCTEWTFPRGGDHRAMATVLSALRDLGLPLGWAPGGWPPGAIFEHARERGLATGGYRRIFSYGPGAWVVTEG